MTDEPQMDESIDEPDIEIEEHGDELPLDEFARAFAQAAAAETPIATLSASTFSAILS